MDRLYVALGDSMSIDDYAGGVGRGAASLLWRNREDDFPEWEGRDLAALGFTGQVLAWDGAMSRDVVIFQLGRIRGVPELVTISVGGNDLFVAYGNAGAAEDAVADVLRNVGEALRGLRERFGAVTAVVSTVYDPSDGTGELGGSGLPPWPDGLEALRVLNDGLARVAGEHGALVADVHGRFLGHGQRVGDPAQLDPRPADRNLWYCGSIEPNAWGASEIRAAWWEALAVTRG